MGIEKYTSEVKTIFAPIQAVYDYLADLSHFDNLFDPEKFEALRQQHPDAPDVKITNFQATVDECTFTISPLGPVGVRIVEREPLKTIKIAGNESIPFPITCWIQLLPIDEQSCKTKVTLQAELSMMIKMMIGKHLQQGVDKLAEGLTKISYPTT